MITIRKSKIKDIRKNTAEMQKILYKYLVNDCDESGFNEYFNIESRETFNEFVRDFYKLSTANDWTWYIHPINITEDMIIDDVVEKIAYLLEKKKRSGLLSGRIRVDKDSDSDEYTFSLSITY